MCSMVFRMHTYTGCLLTPLMATGWPNGRCVCTDARVQDTCVLVMTRDRCPCIPRASRESTPVERAALALRDETALGEAGTRTMTYKDAHLCTLSRKQTQQWQRH